nr:hypothetical protein [Tanacetum cinerariifolium]
MVVHNQEEMGKGLAILTDLHHTPTFIQSSTSQPQKTQKHRKPKRKVTEVPQPSDHMEHVANEAVYKKMDDSLVLDLENTKTTQALKIDSLKRRVKKLEKKQRSRTHRLKRLYKVGLTARVESSADEASLGEDASKQGRKIDGIDADEDITLVNDQDDTTMFDAEKDLQGEEVIVEQEFVSHKETIDKIILAKALKALKNSKPKIRGILIREHKELSESRTTTTTIYSKKSQDKGKGILVEEHVKLKKKDQILLDEEVAKKLQDEINKEERLAGKRAQK